MFPVLFTIPRVAGWIAHWYNIIILTFLTYIFRSEFLDDPENKIVRPRQNYVGYKHRDYIPVKDRKNVTLIEIYSILIIQSFLGSHILP